MPTDHPSRLRRLAASRAVQLTAVAVLAVLVVGAAALALLRPHGTPSLEAARAALDGRVVTVSVLGDSTGNERTEWVSLWAQQLAADRRVTVNPWNTETSSYTQPWQFGAETATRQLTVWNASQPGAKASFATPQLDRLAPQRPDLVIYSFGHNNSSANIATEMGDLHAAVRSRWGEVPEVVVLQNRGSGARGDRQQDTTERLRTWAHGAGLPTIDVAAAFADGGPDLARDDVHPNEAGSRLWAGVVASALD